MAYEINYNDQRFQDVEADKQQALNEVDKTYGEMIGQSDSYYQAQINAAKDWEKQQTENQNQQTDFAIQQIEQQKTQAKKDYTKEQSGAYVDWQKQSNDYGANAEAQAMQGMQNTGYSESSQVSMYNTYQNRVATAKESYNLAVQNYNNAITEARLQNSSLLAEIAMNSLQQQLELSLAGFQYKNQLLLEQANKKFEIDNEFNARFQDVLAQINTENALAEQIRQYNEKMEEEKRQFNEQMALEKEQFEWTKEQANKSSSGGGGGSSRSTNPTIDKPTASTSEIVKNAASTVTAGVNSVANTLTGNTANAAALNAAIAAGATKDDVSNAISNALKNGTITQTQATQLRNQFTPKGVQY